MEYEEKVTALGRKYKLYNPNLLAQMDPIGRITHKRNVAKGTKSSRPTSGSEVGLHGH